MFNEPLILSLCGVVRARLLPRRIVVAAKWGVSCTRITCIHPLFMSRCSLTFLASFFLLFLSLSQNFSFFFPLFSSTIRSFFLIYGLLAILYQLLACLIWAAIVHFSFRLHLLCHR